ncbi:hypothetical protein MNBD_ALPHA12-1397 [hydrothermal vent metagenome]|uniref:Uncharacterized protein n=1 Tax=hydrothermal vent metagenome TaxID=652676 RepID=A0A3B0U682_9ZZZZ
MICFGGYSRRRRGLRSLPRHPLFSLAAVASYGCFPGTPCSFIRAAVAGYTRFSGTPAMGGIHTKNKH